MRLFSLKNLIGNGWKPAEYNENLYGKIWNGVAWDGVFFYAISADGYIIKSFDSSFKNIISKNAELADENWQDIIYDGVLTAISEDGYYAIKVYDNWQSGQIENLKNYHWQKIIYHNGKLVLIDRDGYVSYADDEHLSEFTNPIKKLNVNNVRWQTIVHNGTNYIAIADNGYISISNDCDVWTTPVRKLPYISPEQNGGWLCAECVGSTVYALNWTGAVATIENSGQTVQSINNKNLSMGYGWFTMGKSDKKLVALSQFGHISTKRI